MVRFISTLLQFKMRSPSFDHTLMRSAVSVVTQLAFACVPPRPRGPKLNRSSHHGNAQRCTARRLGRLSPPSAHESTFEQPPLENRPSVLRGVIFDMDGVLCESEEICRRWVIVFGICLILLTVSCCLQGQHLRCFSLYTMCKYQNLTSFPFKAWETEFISGALLPNLGLHRFSLKLHRKHSSKSISVC